MDYEYIWVVTCSDGMGHSQTVGCAKTKKTALSLKEDAPKDNKWAWKCRIKKKRIAI